MDEPVGSPHNNQENGESIQRQFCCVHLLFSYSPCQQKNISTSFDARNHMQNAVFPRRGSLCLRGSDQVIVYVSLRLLNMILWKNIKENTY